MPGDGIIDGLHAVTSTQSHPRGVLLLAEMSSEGNLATGTYTDRAVEMARRHEDVVMGFVSMRQLTLKDPHFVYFTPGVKIAGVGDGLGQTYQDPYEVVAKRKSDVTIVGRGITKADDVVAKAKEYREAAWSAYQQRLEKK